jgi:hypothetical protein
VAATLPASRSSSKSEWSEDEIGPGKKLASDPHGLTQTCNMDINELTDVINGAIFEVNRELGAGFL